MITKLPNRNIDVAVEIPKLRVSKRNVSSINNAIDKLNSLLNTTTENKNTLKEQLKSSYIQQNTLVFEVANKEEDIAKELDKISDLIKTINNSGTKNLTDEQKKELLDAVGNEDTVNDFLEEAGITDDTTEEELEDIAEEAAQELATAISTGEETDNVLANEILEQLNKDTEENQNNTDQNAGNSDGSASNSGLRKDYYDVMQKMNGIQDVKSLIYSGGLATVSSNYFTTGTLLITAHLGGACIVGVGTKILSSAAQNIPSGTKTIQQGAEDTSFPNQVSQSKGLQNGISDMYTNGTTTGLVIGTMTSGDSVVPFTGPGNNISIQHSSVKVLIFVAVLAAFILLAAAAIAAQGIGGIMTKEMVKIVEDIKEQLLETIQNRIISPLDKLQQIGINELKSIIDDATLSSRKKLDKELTLIANKVQPGIDEVANTTLTKVEGGINSLTNKVSSSLKNNSVVKKAGSAATDRIDAITKKATNGVTSAKKSALESSSNLTTLAKDAGESKINAMTDEQVNNKLNEINNEYNKLKQLEDNIQVNIVDNVNKVESKVDGIIKTLKPLIGLGGTDIFKTMIGIPKTFKDGNDFFAAMLAASVKASLALTVVKTSCSVPGSTGTGIMVPVGP